MKILIISNLYPPAYVGGYELACSQFVNFLKGKNHDVLVLTTKTKKMRSLQDCPEIRRLLTWDNLVDRSNFLRIIYFLFSREIKSLFAFNKLRFFKPDIVYAWNMAEIPLSVLYFFNKKNIPVFVYQFDYWMIDYKDPWISLLHNSKPKTLFRKTIKCLLKGSLNILGLLPDKNITFEQINFCSHYIKKIICSRNKCLAKFPVIYWGIDLEKFNFTQKKTLNKLLFVGRVIRDKGTHIAIDILNILAHKYQRNCELNIVGDISDKDYLDQIYKRVSTCNLDSFVKVHGQIDHSEMAKFYNDCSILIFPSVWNEPFGITILEAMASGLAVICSGTGGSSELIENGKTGFIFDTEDPMTAAFILENMFNKPNIFYEIVNNARKKIISNFDINRTLLLLEKQIICQSQ